MFHTSAAAVELRALAAPDIAVRHQEVLRLLENARATKAMCKQQKAAAETEYAAAVSRETAALEALREEEREVFAFVMQSIQAATDAPTVNDIVAALRDYREAENRETNSQNKFLAQLRSSVAEELRDLQWAVETALREAKDAEASRLIWEREASTIRSEILRLQQERLELEANAASTLLRHARELFGVVR